MMRAGRKRNFNAKTHQAAMLAQQLLDDGIGLSGCEPPGSENAAAQQAAAAWGVAADNVRKYMRRLRPPTVLVTKPGQNFGGLGTLPAQSMRVPLVAYVATIKSPDDLARADAEFAQLLARQADHNADTGS